MGNYNDLELTLDTYVLMKDVDRYDDLNYKTKEEAITAMNAEEENGVTELWVGYVEKINEQAEIMFVCGASR